MRFNIIYLLPLLFFCSCEQEVDLNTKFQEKGVVISELAPDREITAIVSYSRPPLSNEAVRYVTDASIIFTNQDQSTIEPLTPNTSNDSVYSSYVPSVPHYISEHNLSALSDERYMIEVNIPNKPLLTAQTSIPSKVTFNNLRSSYFRKAEGSEITYEYDAILDFDHTDTKSRYHIMFDFIYAKFEVSPSNDTTYTFYKNFNGVDKVKCSVPYTRDFDNGILINGEDLPYQNIDVRVEMSALFAPESTPFPPLVFVELRTLSNEYYDYHYSISRAEAQKDSLLTQPIVIPSNIENGLGIFGGYNYSWDLALLPE